ncbi:LLM class F420-dependent oxidoreductase [Streptomyces sp. MNU77]|uniref:LLM class F420-dependent oxidoreductase n=1 Tax=Streptomyces sp. MNU77 TaxID=1573406 RepID=UPI0005E8656C|nr:LLM class F420-dependent oxidoreductase [Streptomyces sp. MNU77]OLO25792.1 LLM class F420-dependent oxidoreductase [Streptomyces sp. MNU77]
MELGIGLSYWRETRPTGTVDLLRRAVDLGYTSAWTAEAYGSDALTPIASYSAQVPELRYGTAVAQLSARTPACAAMSAMTLDHLTDGRFSLGLGVSGPQVVEGWYGAPFARPLERMREYVEIIRRISARDEPVSFEGRQLTLPYPGGTGLGKPLRSILRPVRDLRVLIGAEGPKNVSLAAEIGDGWIAWLFSPHACEPYKKALAEGFARPGARRKAADFEVVASVFAVVDEDVEKAADRVRPTIALYVGGMGAKGANFHYDVVARMGFEAEAARIQEHYLAGRRKDAVAAVPRALVERLALVGPAAKIRDDLAAWRDSPVTTLVVEGTEEAMAAVARARG